MICHQHLFVLTRDIHRDPTAIFLLRSARAIQRRGSPATVFLTGDALQSGSISLSAETAGVVAWGGRVLADTKMLRRLGISARKLGVEPASDRDLAALLVVPGVMAQWC